MLASPAGGQMRTVCLDRDVALKHLAKNYGEVPVAAGLINQGGLIEVLTTIDGSTWTILITTPNGLSCYVTDGEGWRMACGWLRGRMTENCKNW